MDATTIKNAITALEEKAKAFLADDRWKSSRLWATIVALVLVLVLHHLGIDKLILVIIAVMHGVFMTLRTIDDINRDRCNVELHKADCSVEIAKINKGISTTPPAK